MEQEVLFEKSCEIIREITGIEKEKITLNASLRDDLQADSLASVEIVMALEDCFKIEIDEELARTLVTVSDLIEAIQAMLATGRTEAV